MQKYLVIGNPINHSLSKELHNSWIKENKIDAVYEKREINESDIEGIINKIRSGEIDGVNVTAPFKKSVIPFLDELSDSAKESQSVNTIYKKDNHIIGHNTDIVGFELSLKHSNFDIKDKVVFILGAGGVVPSIILALKKLGASKIFLSNRTSKKAEYLKKQFPEIEIIDWGSVPDCDMVVNATSIGLKEGDVLDIDYESIGSDKFFYDVTYNPKETSFLKKGKELGNLIQNGEMMFMYQASEAFKIWHNIIPKINNEIFN